MDSDSTQPGTDKVRDLRAAVTVVVPCYNAGPRIEPVIQALGELVDHVIVVDDGSTDGAVRALAKTGAEFVTFPYNRGKGFAILSGFQAALERPEALGVAIIDADGQHAPRELSRLFGAFMRDNADLVIGARAFDEQQVPWTSRLGNKLTARLTRRLLRQNIPDTQSGYRLHSRRLVEHLLTHVRGGRYETEMQILVEAVRGGFRVTSVPIQTIYERGNPSSHFNRLSDSYRIWRQLLRAARRKA
jgi:glycosyltransferase involved in cell wall biosynthesis